jgi:hypothetical protein
MGELIPFIGPIVSGATTLAGAGIQADAAGRAAEAQLQGTLAGIEANRQAREQAYKMTSPLRDFSASALLGLAKQSGYATGPFEDPSSGFSLPGYEGGPSNDPYTNPLRDSYPSLAAPYLDQMARLRAQGAGIMDTFTAPLDAGGQPTWYRNALAGFKQSPGYQFARDEALRQFNQSAGGHIYGGGRLREGERIAANLGAQDFGNFRTNIIDSILSGAKIGMGATQQQADLLGNQLNWLTNAYSKEDDRYANYFNRLLQQAGLGSAATTKTAELGITSGTNAAQLYQNLGTAEAKGINQQASALGQGIQQLTQGVNAPLSSQNIQSYLSSNDSSSAPGDYGGGGDYPGSSGFPAPLYG